MSTEKDRRDDGGVTLVELIVVISLLAVVGSIVTTGIVAALRSAALTDQKVEALTELELANQLIIRDLRGAEVFLIDDDAGDALSVFVADGAGDLRPVRYEVDDGELLRIDGTGRAIVTALGNDADTEPVFSFYDAQSSFDPNAQPISPCDADGCEGLSVVRVRLVRLVDAGTPVVIETDVSVRNVRYGSTVINPS